VLELTRRIGDVVCVYVDNKKIAEISIVGVRGQHVRLGLDASNEVGFVRKELVKENQE
jgi:carbon storage regulator